MKTHIPLWFKYLLCDAKINDTNNKYYLLFIVYLWYKWGLGCEGNFHGLHVLQTYTIKQIKIMYCIHTVAQTKIVYYWLTLTNQSRLCTANIHLLTNQDYVLQTYINKQIKIMYWKHTLINKSRLCTANIH